MTDEKPNSIIEVRIDGNQLKVTHPNCGGMVDQELESQGKYWELECVRCNRKWWISTFGQTERLWEVANSGEEQEVAYGLGITPDSADALVTVRRSGSS